MRQRRITKCDRFKDYKIRQSWITNCDKNFKKWITKCDGIKKRDGLQSDTVQMTHSTSNYKLQLYYLQG